MPDEYTITVPGPPPRKNWRDRISTDTRTGHMRRSSTREFRKFCRDVRLWSLGLKPITEGAWHLEVMAYWPKQDRQFIQSGRADVDAPVSSVMDALQRAGVIDDDMRIQTMHAAKGFDKDNPRTVIRLERLR